MVGIEVDELDVAGLCGLLSLRVPAGQMRAIVVPRRRVARAIADAVSGLTPSDRVTVTGRVRLVPSDGALLPHLTVLETSSPPSGGPSSRSCVPRPPGTAWTACSIATRTRSRRAAGG